jgi:putative oxidoreductase
MAKCSLDCVSKYGSQLYGVFRVLVGLMFFMHGAGKLFGWFGGTAQALGSLIGVAGIVETLAGLFILLGLWSRLGALGGAVTMLVAYFYVHVGGGLNPLTNGGEMALLYLAAFLVVLRDGNGSWSLEKKVWNKERF